MSNNISSTEYDDVFRTMLNDFPNLAIPLLNEFFGTSFTDKNKVHLGSNELFMSNSEGSAEKIITDSSLYIDDDYSHRYHIECQSTNDNSMLIRMFEYDTQIALSTKENIEKDLFVVNFPRSGILYLRSNANTPNIMHIRINFPTESFTYDVNVIKMKSYTLKEILNKNLLFLLPFYIFNLEDSFKTPKGNEDYMKQISDDYTCIASHLNQLVKEGKITEYLKVAIRNWIDRTVAKIAENYQDVKEGVTDIMGGKIIDYEAKTIYLNGINTGRTEGRAEGRLEGRAEGENIISEMYAWLMSNNRLEEMQKALKDTVLRAKLMNEYTAANLTD